MLERIQKIISAAGVASRRAAEQLMLEGRVRVNGKVVTELGTKADPDHDHIKVDGKLINPHQQKVYLMLYKPLRYVTTMWDPEDRPKVTDLVTKVKTRVYPVGRLDWDTDGLLLMTNDGAFAYAVTHPSHELPKTYRARIRGVLTPQEIEQLESGMYLADGKTAPAKVRIVGREGANQWVDITIHQGKKRQVRRMFDHLNHEVLNLTRTHIGPLWIGVLKPGEYRHLRPEEVNAIFKLAEKMTGEKLR